MKTQIRTPFQYQALKRAGFMMFIALIAFAAVPALDAYAIYILPKRLFIEDRQVAGRLGIKNMSKQTIVAEFGWQRRYMMPDGGTGILEEGQSYPGYKPADDFLKFSPRRAILKPEQYQKIRVLAQRPAGLEPGEYHSHFLISEEPLQAAEKKAGTAPEGGPKKEGIQAKLVVKVSKAIPVFIRHGETTLDLKVTGASLFTKQDKKGRKKDFLRLSVDNNSTRSVYGRVELICGEASAIVSGLKVYPEAPKLTTELLVKEPIPANCGSNMIVRISGVDDFEYKNKVIAEGPVAAN